MDLDLDPDRDDGVPAPEPKAVVAESAKGSDKVYSKSAFRITSLDLGQKWRATSVGSEALGSRRACKEVGSTSDENFSEAEDALMVMLLAGARTLAGATLAGSCRFISRSRPAPPAF